MDITRLEEKLLRELNIEKFKSPLTYKDILELYNKVNKSKLCTLKELSTVIGFEHDWLRKKVFSIKQESKNLRGQVKEGFMNQLLCHERKIVQPKASTSSQIQDIVDDTTERTLKENIETLQSTVSNLNIEISSLKEDNIAMKETIRKLETRNNSSETRLMKKTQIIRKYQTRQKIILKSLKRKIVNITKQKTSNSQLKRGTIVLKKKIKLLTGEKRNLENEKKDLLLQLSMEKGKNLKVNEADETVLQSEINDLKASLSYVEHLLQDEKCSTVETFDSEKQSYSTETQLCIMNLLSEGVGVHHVNNVLTHVATLCGKTLSKLPSVSTINRIGDQRASVSYMQMDAELSSKENTTLQSDETRKHGDVYEVFSVRDNNQKEWILGLKDMKDKSSESCLNTLNEVIKDISECTTTDTGKKILVNIKNTMSDRAASEKKFHELLKNYREEILPSFYSGWEELSDVEKESVTSMNNFYCGLHILVNMAEVSDNIICNFESNFKGDENLGAEAHPETKPFTGKGESGAVRLIRTACKCFARGADEKSGCYSNFKTFLSCAKKSSKLLVPFRGNRFNILFYNAEIILFLSTEIIEYFEKVEKPTNRLQKAVYYDIKVELYLATLKALGLCSKLITAPFWRVMENKQCSLEEACHVYQKLDSFFTSAKNDCVDLLCGDSPLPNLVKKDEVYQRLMMTDEFDAKTTIILQQILGGWSTLLKKAASDFLLGGKFYDIDETTASQTLSTRRHNKFPERVFALLDALTRFRPVASTLCNEAYIMFSLNKTGDWINSLSSDEKKMYLDKARKEGREVRKKYLDRMSLEEAQKEVLNRKRLEIQKKEQKQVKEKEDLTNDMLYYGLWQYPEVVDERIKGIQRESEKRKALKTQLQFRKTVLGQTGDRKLFQVSEKGKLYTIEKLVDNVKMLIKAAIGSDNSSKRTENIFIGRKIIHYQMEDNKRVPFRGRVISNVPGYPDWYRNTYNIDKAIF